MDLNDLLLSRVLRARFFGAAFTSAPFITVWSPPANSEDVCEFDLFELAQPRPNHIETPHTFIPIAIRVGIEARGFRLLTSSTTDAIDMPTSIIAPRAPMMMPENSKPRKSML